MILIIDFGSQTTHLIGRRIQDLGVEVEIIDPAEALSVAQEKQPEGLIFSGGPASVYEEGAPTVDIKIFDLNIPILGICYGWQLMAQTLGGKVISGHKEYGPANLQVTNFTDLFYGFKDASQVWESHGDSVIKLPEGFSITASTTALDNAAVANYERKMYGVQFHPEVSHSEQGGLLLTNFVTRICNLGLHPKDLDTDQMIASIREKVGDHKVIGAFSGGTDSAVAGALVAKAIGKQFIPVYIDSGLMRDDTLDRIQNDFPKVLGIPVVVVEARQEFLDALEGISDPEEKRKTIGKLYIDLFEKEMQKHEDVSFLMQGTTYADFIHSQGSKRSAHIKSHHNVGGLPKDMKLQLLEPLKYFYTDQVRQIGLKIGLPHDMVYQQPFPGPGHAVRILGSITKEKLEKQRLADSILLDEMKKSGWYDKVFQCWTIVTNAQSTAVKGDGRFFGDVIALRIVDSKDRMTADWVRVPYDVLARISARIVNEVPNVSRVVFDITTKPPATMEWE